MVEALRRRSSLLGVVVPLALLAGQISTVVHSMVVEHRRCPEHGELVHQTRAVTNASPSPSASALPDGWHWGPTVIGAAERQEQRHGHDHCVSLCGRREITGPSDRASAADPTPTAHAALAPEGSASRIDRGALLALAPKTSPPPTS